MLSKHFYHSHGNILCHLNVLFFEYDILNKAQLVDTWSGKGKKCKCADCNIYSGSWSLSFAICWRMLCKVRQHSWHLPVLLQESCFFFYLDDRCCVSSTKLILYRRKKKSLTYSSWRATRKMGTKKLHILIYTAFTKSWQTRILKTEVGFNKQIKLITLIKLISCVMSSLVFVTCFKLCRWTPQTWLTMKHFSN